jgi:prophage regulatory protein
VVFASFYISFASSLHIPKIHKFIFKIVLILQKGTYNMSQDTVKNNKVLLLDDVKKLTGFSRSTIYRLIADGSFPKQFKRSERLVAWLESDIQAWLQSRITQSRS